MKKIPLNLVYLKYFCDAVKHGSVSASAKTNCVSQSAVSQAIAKLEEGMGYDLIEHQPNRFKVTKEGERLFEGSKSIFQTIRVVEEGLAEEGKGRIEFACTHSFALALLPQHLKRAGKDFPNLHLSFRLGHTGIIKEWIKKGLVDFGIVLDNDDLSSFDCEEIYEGQYRLYISEKCSQEAMQSFLLSEERRETNLLKKSYRNQYGKDLPVLMEVSSWEVIARLTEEGLGVGFFPDYIAHGKYAALKPLSLDIEPIYYKIYAIFPKNARRSGQITSFLKIISGSA